MSDTPRTDAAAWVTATREPVVFQSHARQLERELNAAKAKLAELKKQSGLTPERISPLTIKRPPSRGTSNRRDNR
jgi:hypothetical protein